MMKQVCPLMLQFFVARLELLIASIANGSATQSVSSLWNKNCLDKNAITSQITAWIALGIKWYVSCSNTCQDNSQFITS